MSISANGMLTGMNSSRSYWIWRLPHLLGHVLSVRRTGHIDAPGVSASPCIALIAAEYNINRTLGNSIALNNGTGHSSMIWHCSWYITQVQYHNCRCCLAERRREQLNLADNNGTLPIDDEEWQDIEQVDQPHISNHHLGPIISPTVIIGTLCHSKLLNLSRITTWISPTSSVLPVSSNIKNYAHSIHILGFRWSHPRHLECVVPQQRIITVSCGGSLLMYFFPPHSSR